MLGLSPNMAVVSGKDEEGQNTKGGRGMYDVKAYAVRKDGVISVTITGNLPNSCYEASVVDKYPGGNIVYVVDPGSAQIFIKESTEPGSEICLMYLVPWVGHAKIPDETHDQVTVFINGEPEVIAQVQKEPEQYRVIALTASAGDGYQGCSVIPADAFYLAIYSSVFGPATKAECDKWLIENCVKIP